MKFFEHFVHSLESLVHVVTEHHPQSLQGHRLTMKVFTRSLQHGLRSPSVLGMTWRCGRWRRWLGQGWGRGLRLGRCLWMTDQCVTGGGSGGGFDVTYINKRYHSTSLSLWTSSSAAVSRHQSPEWMILSHISCFIQGEVVGFQVFIRVVRGRPADLLQFSKGEGKYSWHPFGLAIG